jgi:glycosyltransferase involved in cell wall biosynthesis
VPVTLPSERGPAPRVAVIVPVFNNVTTLGPLCERLRRAFPPGTLEIVLVDDGSTDGSRALLESSGARRVLHERNLGQNQAILTGLGAASDAEVYCALDADLEDPPEALPALVAVVQAGQARAAFSTRDESRRLSSRLFRWTLRAFFPTLPPYASLCFAVDRATRNQLVEIGLDGDYVVALIGAMGIPTIGVPIRRAPRGGGRTAYTGLARYRYAAGMLRASLRAKRRMLRGQSSY